MTAISIEEKARKAVYMREYYHRNREKLCSSLWARRNGLEARLWIPREATPKRWVKGREYLKMARNLLVQRDGLLCGVCGFEMDIEEITIDHIIPLTRGGTDEATNLRLAHAKCNVPKGSYALEQAGVC